MIAARSARPARPAVRRATLRTLVLGALLLATTAACGKKEEEGPVVGGGAGTVATREAVKVTDVKLGKQVGADMRVTDETDDFDTGDMINASVLTSGNSPNTMLTARWTFEDGQVVDSTTQTIAPTGDAATVFHIMKPGGFPKGKYKLQVMLNGAEVKVKEFKVD